MNLQGRRLSPQTPPSQGNDVKPLQDELGQLGFTTAEPGAETLVFNVDTRQAILTFERQHSVPVTGVVDDATAKAINVAVNAFQHVPIYPLAQLTSVPRLTPARESAD